MSDVQSFFHEALAVIIAKLQYLLPHIIVRARRALMGPYSEVVLVCMYVCMYVHNGFTTEVP